MSDQTDATNILTAARGVHAVTQRTDDLPAPTHLAAYPKDGLVRLAIETTPNESVTYAFAPEDALRLGELLIKHARELGKP